MLDYPTCLKLKEAGFPQKRALPTGRRQADGADIWFADGYAVTEMPASEPTLEELIEACGEEFKGLLPPNATPLGGWAAIKEVGWVKPMGENATPFHQASWESWNVVCGPTPEEAVANLYLALKK